jgi:hypothetical protein
MALFSATEGGAGKIKSSFIVTTTFLKPGFPPRFLPRTNLGLDERLDKIVRD